MIKILHITKYFNSYGGIEKLTNTICEQLVKKYKKLDVLSFSNIFDKKIKFHKKINVINCKTNFTFKSTPISFQMFKFLKDRAEKYDIIHITVPNPWPTIILTVLNIKIKKIIISWGSDIISQKFLRLFFKPFQNKLLTKAEKILCLSETYANHSSDLRKFKKKITILRPILKPIKNKKIYKTNKKTFSILSIGRLVPYKGYDVLLSAARLLPSHFVFNLIGDGPQKRQLKEKIKEYNLEKRFIIHSKINEDKKNKFLKNSDLFCFTSNTRAESFGISLLEAINYSLPVIVSNNKGSGMLDMIIDSYNGFIFEKNSPLDLKKKILTLCKNKKKLIKFSKNSKILFNKRFNTFENNNKIFEIYKNFTKNASQDLQSSSF